MKQKLIFSLLIGALLLTACGGNKADATPTVDPNLIQTQAVQTFSANLTQTAFAQPTDTPFPTLTASATFAPFTSASTLPAVSQPTLAATKSCYSMAFVSDVTIPDNTAVAPGQTFTKTWNVVNNGSCAWDAGFKFAFTGGDAMGGTTYTLPSAVAVNSTTNLSITMTAPTNKTGTVQSNWRMSTASGQFFGDEIYVIVVVGGGTLTPAATATTAPPATATATDTEIPTATATP
jgi:Ig-like domain from next to BRCA1 gene